MHGSLDNLNVSLRCGSKAHSRISAPVGRGTSATILRRYGIEPAQRIRVTAQLINAEDGYHVWSERDDRKLTDVVTIQDDITEGSPTTIAIAAFEVFRQRAAPEGAAPLCCPPGVSL